MPHTLSPDPSWSDLFSPAPATGAGAKSSLRVKRTRPVPARRVLIIGARPTEVAAVAQSFFQAGARVRSTSNLDDLVELVASTEWTFVVVDHRWRDEVEWLLLAEGEDVPVESYGVGVRDPLGPSPLPLPIARSEADLLLRRHARRISLSLSAV